MSPYRPNIWRQYQFATINKKQNKCESNRLCALMLELCIFTGLTICFDYDFQVNGSILYLEASRCISSRVTVAFITLTHKAKRNVWSFSFILSFDRSFFKDVTSLCPLLLRWFNGSDPPAVYRHQSCSHSGRGWSQSRIFVCRLSEIRLTFVLHLDGNLYFPELYVR